MRKFWDFRQRTWHYFCGCTRFREPIHRCRRSTLRSTRKALVVRGGWEGHHPVEATELFLPFLTANGFEVQVEESNEIYADAAAIGTVLLVLVAIVVVPYLVKTNRQEK